MKLSGASGDLIARQITALLWRQTPVTACCLSSLSQHVAVLLATLSGTVDGGSMVLGLGTAHVGSMALGATFALSGSHNQSLSQ